MNLRSGKKVRMDQIKETGLSNTDIEQAKGDESLQEPSANLDMRKLIEQMSHMISQNFEIQNKNIQKLESKIETENKKLTEKIDQTVASLENKITTLHTKLVESNTALYMEIERTNTKLDKVEIFTQNLEKEILEKVNNEVENKVSRVDEHLMKSIDVLNEKLDQETKLTREKIEKSNVTTHTIQHVYDKSLLSFEHDLIFTGDRKLHPKVFIKNLKEEINELPEGRNIKHFIRNKLKGDAETWYSIIEDKYETVEEFVDLFLNNYWSENYQAKIRESLFNGKYVENKGCGREKYILRKYSYVQHLEPRMPDGEVVKYFARHFNENIRDVILIQGIDTIEKLLQYLRRLDDVKLDQFSNNSTGIRYEKNNNYEERNNGYRREDYGRNSDYTRNNQGNNGEKEWTGNKNNYYGKYQNRGYTDNQGRYNTYQNGYENYQRRNYGNRENNGNYNQTRNNENDQRGNYRNDYKRKWDNNQQNNRQGERKQDETEWDTVQQVNSITTTADINQSSQNFQ